VTRSLVHVPVQDVKLLNLTFKRLKELESLALQYPGVMKTYAIQAGRSLRVIVGAEKVTDKDAENLSFEIARKNSK